MGLQIGNNRRSALSEINVTPLVDVMLVLLIIFMVTAPLIQQGVAVNLPKADATPVELHEEALILTVSKEGEIYLSGEKSNLKIEFENLTLTLEQILETRSKKEIYLKGDREVPYGRIVEVMSAVKKAGIDKIGMITEPNAEH